MALKRPMRLSPNDPDAARLIAKYPGRYVMTTRGPFDEWMDEEPVTAALVLIFILCLVMVLFAAATPT